MKLLTSFKQQISQLKKLKYVWFTSFNINIEFIETYLIPVVLGVDPPKSRLDYENYQFALTDLGVDLRVFCDKRFMNPDRQKRTAIPIHGVSPGLWHSDSKIKQFSTDSLFHPKVIYLEDEEGKRILGVGSANLTLSGWGRNQEVFAFYPVETKDQYDSIRNFFDVIAANVDLPKRLKERRGLPREKGEWQFVHSFQTGSFVEKLFDNNTARELLVWTPYLSKDLATFIKRLKANVASEELKVHLVPDRINGQFIRTPLTEKLHELCNQGLLAFYENPTTRHQNVELCHAKVWMLGDRLAIGSWNFTCKGANLLYETGEWDNRVNIEAGVIVRDDSSWLVAKGKKIEINASAFASEELLVEKALQVPEDIPFDIQVSFDWGKQIYEFTGHWHDGLPKDGYFIKVPDHEAQIPLIWRPKKRDLILAAIEISNPQALLHERRFQVFHHNSEIYRALIIESNLIFRRAQAFASFNDLINALIFETAGNDNTDAPFRIALDDRRELLPEEIIEDTHVDMSSADGEISYFKLFQAIQHYGERLNAIKSVKDLNNWVFVRPGSLIELVLKTQEKLASEIPTLFNWFLAQEIKALCLKAEKRRKELGKSDDSLPKSRWDELSLTMPPLPSGILPDYVEMIQRECGYVS